MGRRSERHLGRRIEHGAIGVGEEALAEFTPGPDLGPMDEMDAGTSVRSTVGRAALIILAATLVGRFAMIVPMLALAGFLSERKIAPATAGTFPVTTPLFVVLLLGVILIVGALTFFPALALGPILEQLLMYSGRLF